MSPSIFRFSSETRLLNIAQSGISECRCHSFFRVKLPLLGWFSTESMDFWTISAGKNRKWVSFQIMMVCQAFLPVFLLVFSFQAVFSHPSPIPITFYLISRFFANFSVLTLYYARFRCLVFQYSSQFLLPSPLLAFSDHFALRIASCHLPFSRTVFLGIMSFSWVFPQHSRGISPLFIALALCESWSLPRSFRS